MKTSSPICKRCGKCCETSTPTLHLNDLLLLKDKHLEYSHVYTIRRGEVVWDNIEHKKRKTSSELIKIREGASGCFFYDTQNKACRIYLNRPAECIALFCEDTREFFQIYGSPRLTRKHIKSDATIVRLIEEHEKRSSYDSLEALISRIDSEGEAAIEKIIELLRFDYELRNLVQDSLGISLDYLPLLFGRPMIEVIRVYGLEVTKQDDGSFMLTTRA